MSLAEGFTVRAVWASLEEVNRKILGQRIRITSPRPTEQLRHAGTFAGDAIYSVTGTLKRLPKGHQIWLLRVDPASGKAWPQGFYPVQFNRDARTWEGRIKGGGSETISSSRGRGTTDFTDDVQVLRRTWQRNEILTTSRHSFRV